MTTQELNAILKNSYTAAQCKDTRDAAYAIVDITEAHDELLWAENSHNKYHKIRRRVHSILKKFPGASVIEELEKIDAPYASIKIVNLHA